MTSYLQNTDFPSQRVSDAEKEKYEWYSACCDFIIAQGQAYKNINEVEIKYRVLQGDIPEEFYKKTINPYNSKNDKYKRFPATLRNYDLMKGVIRRYVGEYLSNPHDFIVSANNAEVVLAKNSRLRQELNNIIQKQIAAKIQEIFAEYLKQGGNPEEFNPQEQFDVEAFITEFNENFIDEISAQGQQILEVIKDITEDKVKEVAYLNADRVVDTTAAGDFYAAGVMYGLMNDCSLRQCAELGALLAGHVIQVVGTKFDACMWDKVRDEVRRIVHG